MRASRRAGRRRERHRHRPDRLHRPASEQPSSPTATRRTAPTLDAAWPGWDEGLALVVAADGGARHATGTRRPRSIAGSATAIRCRRRRSRSCARRGSRSSSSPAEKDETDTELALRAAVEAGRDGRRDPRRVRRTPGSTMRSRTPRCSPTRRSPAAGPSSSTAGRASGCCAVRRRSRSTVAPAISSRSSRSERTPTA